MLVTLLVLRRNKSLLNINRSQLITIIALIKKKLIKLIKIKKNI